MSLPLDFNFFEILFPPGKETPEGEKQILITDILTDYYPGVMEILNELEIFPATYCYKRKSLFFVKQNLPNTVGQINNDLFEKLVNQNIGTRCKEIGDYIDYFSLDDFAHAILSL